MSHNTEKYAHTKPMQQNVDTTIKKKSLITMSINSCSLYSILRMISNDITQINFSSTCNYSCSFTFFSGLLLLYISKLSRENRQKKKRLKTFWSFWG